MGKNNKLAELLELSNAQKGLKIKKKAIQYECPHKDRKGNWMLKQVRGNDFVFKCKLCKDKKVDLSILDASKGSINEQLKGAFKVFKSGVDLAKIQSNSKDTKTVEILASTLKTLYACRTILKKALKQEKPNRKKGGKRNINVASGGKTLFGGR